MQKKEGLYGRLQNDTDTEFSYQYTEKPFKPNQQMPQNPVQNQNFNMQNQNLNGFPPNSPQQQGNQFIRQNFVQQNAQQNNLFLNQMNNNDSQTGEINSVKREEQTFVHNKLNDFMTKTNSSSKDENFLRTTIDRIYQENQQLNRYFQNEITENIIAIINGYGPLNKYLADKEVTEIICCTFDNIWIEKKGKMMRVPDSFNSEQEFRNVIDSKILQPLGRRVDDAQPLVNARLSDRSRVNVVINPIAADGATLDIRKFKEIGFTINDYVRLNSMTTQMGEFLSFVVKFRKNIIVSGGTGSGKTTLLNCLSAFIPESEAIVTIEDTLELQLAQPCIRRLEARAANAEGTGAVTIRDCLVNALRMRPDRIIVGECRSHEVVDMLQAMNTGHDGSLTTVHANSPKDMIERLYTMYMFAGIGDVPEKAVKTQIASAIHVVVQATRLDDGSRKITRISEIVGIGNFGKDTNNEYVKRKGLDSKFEIKNVGSADIIIQDIFRYDEVKGKFFATGWIPTFWDTIMSKSSKANTSIFKGGEMQNDAI